MQRMPKIEILPQISKLATGAEKLFWSSWWVCAVVLMGGIFLEQGLKALRHEHEQLNQQLSLLSDEKERAVVLRDNYKLQINSQSDPAWVELTLMKELGLVPEGHTKVLFTE